MHDQAQQYPSPPQRFILEIGGIIHIHFHIDFDHAALGAKLREATSELKSAVEANQPSPPVPSS